MRLSDFLWIGVRGGMWEKTADSGTGQGKLQKEKKEKRTGGKRGNEAKSSTSNAGAFRFSPKTGSALRQDEKKEETQKKSSGGGGR